MLHVPYKSILMAAGLVLLIAPSASLGQITVEGVSDRSVHANQVTLRVPSVAGFTDDIYLWDTPVPSDTFVTVDAPDYYELYVFRTPDGVGSESSRMVRFIVSASERGSSEYGIPPHVPHPVVQSSPAEFAGANLRLLAPARFPTGYPIPVVAWVEDPDEHAVRAHGLLADPNLDAGANPVIQIRRGVGSGFLASNHPEGTLDYAPMVGGISTRHPIMLEAAPAWTAAAGILNGVISWPDNARVQIVGNLTVSAGATLNIGPGTIVRLGAGIDITNNGSIFIHGTRSEPVVFMPNSPAAPWGGFIMREGTGEMTATGTIFTGSGADPNWFGNNGNPGSHRDEQGLFYVDDNQSVTLIDCAAIDLAGQLGHARNGGTFVFDHFLNQRCGTAGEYTGANFTVNDSAFIEFPEDSADFADGDNDAIYLVSGFQNFTNTLFGWTKDDGVDSGGSGTGTLVFQSCWFEGIFHEGNALSGSKTVTVRDSVYLNCGQGVEDGYEDPDAVVDHSLFLACQTGARHGDNYQTIGNYEGYLTVTNSILLGNHRDLFAHNWRSTGWTNNYGQMTSLGNWITKAHTNFPGNHVWDPATDAHRLIPFQAAGRVGVSFLTRPGETSLSAFPEGLPIGLSRFCTNVVTVDATIQSTGGPTTLVTVVFHPGDLVRSLVIPPALTGVLRITLGNVQNADNTGVESLVFQNVPEEPGGDVVLVPRGAVWKYLDDGSNQGTAWRAPGFDDDGWESGGAELGYGDNDEVTTVGYGGVATAKFITTYFRHAFEVEDPAAFGGLALEVLRDDGVVVYLDGQEVFRDNMGGGTITYTTLAGRSINGSAETTYLNPTLTTGALAAGNNVMAVEIHQRAGDSSDISFNLGLTGIAPSQAPRLFIGRLGDEIALSWRESGWTLEEAAAPTGSWTALAGESPVVVASTGVRFFRLRQ